jgi:aldoxime dehydratase
MKLVELVELAIAPHLRCPRSRDRLIDDDYAPMFPGYVIRPSPSVSRVVMGHFGVQSAGPARKKEAWAALRRIVASFDMPDGPGHHELAFEVDTAGYDNFIAFAYWNEPDRFARWLAHPDIEEWWQSPQRMEEGVGYFREIVTPRIERYESLLSDSDRPEGGGMVLGSVSQMPVQEHGYWGSSRDRMPSSQTDEMLSAGALTVEADARSRGRVRVAGHENMVFIRSGQDWADTDDKERALYVRKMEPALHAGMGFLAREGAALGCYVNRYMGHLDPSGQPMEKTFGMAYWRSMADIEHWAGTHPTHKAIVGAFPPVARQLNFDLKLRLYHEVAVLKADEQSYEYIHCHPATGLAGGAVLQGRYSSADADARCDFLGKPAVPIRESDLQSGHAG